MIFSTPKSLLQARSLALNESLANSIKHSKDFRKTDYILYSGRLADNSSKGGKGLGGVSVLCLGLDFCVARSEWNFVARD